MEVFIIQPQKKQTNSDLYNDLIPNVEFLIIDQAGTQLGTFSRKEALEIAEKNDTDIVVVSPNSKPMVAKLMDYSKYRYEQQKKLREMKKNQTVVQLKEIRLSPVIDTNDFNTKVKHAHKFLSKGDKVKVAMRFRGRMIVHVELGKEVMNKLIEQLAEVSSIEASPKLEGNSLIAILAPIKQ